MKIVGSIRNKDGMRSLNCKQICKHALKRNIQFHMQNRRLTNRHVCAQNCWNIFVLQFATTKNLEINKLECLQL